MRNYTTSHFGFLMLLLYISLLSCFQEEIFARKTDIWEMPLKRCWTYQPEEAINFIGASDNNKDKPVKPVLNLNDNLINTNPYIFLFSNSSIKSLEKENQNIIWETKLGGAITGKPLITGTNIYLITTVYNNIQPYLKSYFLFSINSNSGVIIWKKELTLPSNIFVNSELTRILLLDKANNLENINLENGSKIWSIKFSENILDFLEINEKNYILNANNEINVISSGNGTILDKFILTNNNYLSTKIAGTDDQIVWSNELGLIKSINLRKRKVTWQRKLGAKITNIRFYKNSFLVSSLDNYFYILSKDTGQIIFKKRFEGRITEDPINQGDLFAIASYNSQSIILIDVIKKKVVNIATLSDAEMFATSFTFSGNTLLIATKNSVAAFSPNCE